MKRAIVFVFFVVAFLLWTFPHRMIVERVLARRLAGVGATIDLGPVSPALWPPGYRIAGTTIGTAAGSLRIDSLHVALWPWAPVRFDARACDGRIDGAVDSRGDGQVHLMIRLHDADPSRCLTIGSLVVSGRFTGVLEARASSGPSERALRVVRAELEGSDGSVSGHLPPVPGAASADASSGRPIGTWEFRHARLRASTRGSDLLIERAEADAQDIRWEVVRGRLARDGRRLRVTIDLRARAEADSPRAKAVLGLLPKAAESSQGWRRYRISGTADAPKVVGLR